MAMLHLLCIFVINTTGIHGLTSAVYKPTARKLFCHIQLLEFDDQAKHLNNFQFPSAEKAQIQYRGLRWKLIVHNVCRLALAMY